MNFNIKYSINNSICFYKTANKFYLHIFYLFLFDIVVNVYDVLNYKILLVKTRFISELFEADSLATLGLENMYVLFPRVFLTSIGCKVTCRDRTKKNNHLEYLNKTYIMLAMYVHSLSSSISLRGPPLLPRVSVLPRTRLIQR